jgi:hypothetical protein
VQDGSYVAGTGAPQIFTNFGNAGKLRNKAVYFVRQAAGAIDTSKARIVSV